MTPKFKPSRKKKDSYLEGKSCNLVLVSQVLCEMQQRNHLGIVYSLYSRSLQCRSSNLLQEVSGGNFQLIRLLLQSSLTQFHKKVGICFGLSSFRGYIVAGMKPSIPLGNPMFSLVKMAIIYPRQYFCKQRPVGPSKKIK